MVLLSSAPAAERGGSTASLGQRVRRVLVTGAALTIPLLITVMILVFVVDFILRTITPVVDLANDAFGIGQNVDPLAMKLLAIVTFVVMVFLVGLVGETRVGDELERMFDAGMARIPGVGSLYTSFNEMTNILLSNDAESFRDVKLVEYPTQGSYSIAFVTADPPPTIGEATGHDGVTTLFMPLAPNPVMGGYVVHVSDDRVYDVDMTVEEGVRSLVTSGVATGESGPEPPEGELVDFEAIRKQARGGVEGLGAWGTRTVGDLSDLTGEAAGDIREQAYREFAAIHPDLDESEVDDEAEVRHYMLDEFGSGDGETGAGDPSAGETGDDDASAADTPSPDGDGSGGQETDSDGSDVREADGDGSDLDGADDGRQRDGADGASAGGDA